MGEYVDNHRQFHLHTHTHTDHFDFPGNFYCYVASVCEREGKGIRTDSQQPQNMWAMKSITLLNGVNILKFNQIELIFIAF